MNLKKKAKSTLAPVDRDRTVRQRIISILEDQRLSARDLSAEAGVSEKEVYEHLRHIQKTADKKDFALLIDPPECKRCGFSFKKREKLKRPGKCPVCRKESITEPLFKIGRR